MASAGSSPAAAGRDLGGNDRPKMLDGARGIGIACVVASHVTMTAVTLDQIFFTQAWVAMFFALSGFLLYHPFVAARYSGQRYSIRTFAWRRVLRIVPAAWLCFLLAGLLLDDVLTLRSGQWFAAFSFTQIYGFDTMLNGLGQVWSLDAEVALYSALGVWMLVTVRRAPARPDRMLVVELAPLALVTGLSGAWIATSISPDAAGTAVKLVSPAAWMGLFAAGMALAVLRVHSRLAGRAALPLRIAARAPVLFWLGAALTLVALAYVVDAGMSEDGQVVSGGAWLVKYLLDVAFALLLLTPCAVDRGAGGLVRAAFACWPAVELSRISYGVFLWHFPVVRALVDAGVSRNVGIAGLATATFALSILLGMLSYRLIERPAMLLGHRTKGPSDAFRLLRRGFRSSGSAQPATSP